MVLCNSTFYDMLYTHANTKPQHRPNKPNPARSLMYSFAQRADTAVLDEPLYAHYLRLTGAARPYRDLVMRAQDADGARVVREQLLAPRAAKPVLFAKHMAKQKVGLADGGELWRRAAHVLLLREPYGVVASFARVLQHPTLAELGYAALAEIASELRALGCALMYARAARAIVDGGPFGRPLW